jgi:hypothetical protein
MDGSSATNEVGLAATAANPFIERDLRGVRSLAGVASLVLIALSIAWSTVFASTLSWEAVEREPVNLVGAALLCVTMIAAGLAWWQPRLGGLVLVGVGLVYAIAIMLPDPDVAVIWIVLGAALWAAPPVFTGLLWLWYARMAGRARGAIQALR